ncbi:MAG: CheR family methyltransferase [Ginsengibacter sp.]
MSSSKKNSVKAKKPISKKSGQPHEMGAAPFPVAGIGSSAGGLEALKVFLESLSPATGMAFVIIQHLAPDHQSILPELLEKKTQMPVLTVEDGMKIEANHVYVIPPNTYMSIVDGHLTLSPRNKGTLFLPIDFFLKNLGLIYQNKAIGIILSGSGSDGTIGAKDIKAEGGITFAQDNSAGFSGMPTSAIDAGYVDFILSPDRIAKDLSDIVKHPYTRLSPTQIQQEDDSELRRILIILHNKKGIDFSLYKMATIVRRILRRVALNRKKSLADYSQLLRENTSEVEKLYQDLLINVTTFFRDPLIFKSLGQIILPAIIKDRKSGDIIRIWVAACASGEEAFSFAISISEFLSEKGLTIPFHIFATDLNKEAIEKARSGLYHVGNLENVTPERLRKFFTKVDGHYQVIKTIRDACVFATHNLLADPPFSKMDLVSCQNVMIYFEQKAQKKILKAFHYALKPTGYLLLGKSETIGSSTDFFAPVNKESRLYTRKENANHFDFDFSFPARPSFVETKSEVDTLNKEKSKELDIEKETDKLLLSQYVPASVVVNADMQVLRFHGSTSRYLQPVFGKASLHLLKMVPDDLVFELRTLIQKVKKEGSTASKKVKYLLPDGETEMIILEVMPVHNLVSDTYFLILFKPSSINYPDVTDVETNTTDIKIIETRRILALEQELREAKEHIKITGEEFEATKEELQSANEEVLSSNEELQSINEELETSKEELQSANEELITINEELHIRNNDLREAFEYREAIVETINEPLMVLTTELRVQSANKAFYKNFKQKQNETEGHYLSEMQDGQWDIPELKAELLKIISKEKTFKSFEVSHDFSDVGNRVILFSAARMRIEEKKKTRILLVIEDITKRREAEKNLLQSLNTNTLILNSISDLFISVDNKWNFIFINSPAEAFIGRKQKDIIGKNLWEILSRFMDSSFHKMLISSMKTKTFATFEYYEESTKDWFLFRLYPSPETFSIYGSRITEEKMSQQLLHQSQERYESFISENTEGIWRFELTQAIPIRLSTGKQLNDLYNKAFIAECYDAMAKMHDLKSAKEMVGVTAENLLAKNETFLTKWIASDYHLTDEETIEEKEGEIIYYLNNLTGIIENQSIVRIWGTQRDITKQKLIEKNLLKTKQQLDFSLTAGSVGAFIWHIKTDQLTWTKVQKTLYGLDDAQQSPTFTEWYRLVHPDDVSLLQIKIEESIKMPTDLSVEFRIIWPDESVHWIFCRANVVYDNDGKPLEMSGINIDISDRKFKEQLIRESEERFKALVQNSFDVITVFNYAGTITYQSDSIERVLGYAAEERLGKNIFKHSLVHPNDLGIERELFDKCIVHPYHYFQSEFRLRHQDGSYRIMEVSCINLADNSSIHGLIKTYRDVTERRTIEKQKEEFIGVASHELKTPVTSIKGYAQILQKIFSEKGDDASANLLSKMDHQIDRLTKLIRDLLDVTKITEGQLQLDVQEYDLTTLIKEVSEDMQMTSKKHELVLDLQPV